MNQLLNESDAKGLGATFVKLNVCLTSYCDDLIILSIDLINPFESIIKIMY
jgi:hypothetical protein